VPRVLPELQPGPWRSSGKIFDYELWDERDRFVELDQLILNPQSRQRRGVPNPRKGVRRQQRNAEIVAAANDGLTKEAIAEMFELSPVSVYGILRTARRARGD
jgi:hypothetical protein